MSDTLGIEGKIGPYRIIRVVGSGGMGVVHEAWDTRLERRVALKMLHPHLMTDPAMSARFEREAKKAARIEHPNVVRVYRVDSIDGQVAIEMEYIDGLPLSTLLRSGPLTLGQAADLLGQVLEALEACHKQGVIHCDLKPGNLLVKRDGRVELTDFGIARALYEGGETASASEPMSGPMWGTPQYSPPEAWEGGAVTPKWDLYAAGALIYETIVGKPPFKAPNPAALMNAILSANPAPLVAERPEISSAFATLIETLMARQPEARPPSAHAALMLLRNTPEFNMDVAQTEPLRIPEHREIARTKTVNAANDTSDRVDLRYAAGLSLVSLVLLCVVAYIYLFRESYRLTDRIIPPPRENKPGAAELLVIQGVGGTPTVALFSADDGIHGRELWWVDLAEKPQMVTDLVAGAGSSNPSHLTARPQNGFVFTATTPESGEELWFASNVGETGRSIKMIKDIIPGPMGSTPIPIAAKDTLVLFYATTLTAGAELWCTNAQNEQRTAMVADVFPGVQSSLPIKPVVTPDADGAYICALADVIRGRVLFRYDFLSNSLRDLGDVGEETVSMARAGGKLFFANTDSDHGYEVWVYDEKTGELALFADLWPGSESSKPSQFWSWEDRVLFQAQTRDSGLELWSSDGTAAGTMLVSDINPGRNGSDPYGFVSIGDYVFFRAKDDVCGQELWVTDGTKDGTARVADIMQGRDSGNPYNLVAYGAQLVFTAKDAAHGEELWVATPADGAWKAELLADIYPGPQNSEPHQLQWADEDHAFFLAKTPNAGETVCRLSAPPDAPLTADTAVISVIPIVASKNAS